MNTKVLVVEDDFLIARDIKNILMEDGYNVIVGIDDFYVATNTIEETKPDIVLLDINLKKDKDGVDIAKHLLIDDKVPFIYLTGSTDRTTLDRVLTTRPYGFLVKPFRPVDLKTTVSIALNNYKHRKIDVLRYEETNHSNVPFVLKNVIDFINKNINEKIEISDLTQLTPWNSQHFSRIFKKYMKITPHKYITERKIEKAKVLLIETTLPITQISFELGFKSHSNFCQLFKKLHRSTPENYRIFNRINNCKSI